MSHSAVAVGLGCALLIGCLGCSTTNNTTVVDTKCGPGTELVDGTCVPTSMDAAADQSSPPDTATPLDSSTTDGSLVETAPDAPVDTFALGDPCPAKPVDVNCSSSCAGSPTQLNCSKVKCGTPFASTLRVKETDLPFVMRTPDKPGTDPACAASTCAPTSALAYGMFIRTVFLAGNYFKATVAPPWQFYQHTGGDYYCPAAEWGQCIVAAGTDVLVGTRDPSAVPRNVVFEPVPYGTKCP